MRGGYFIAALLLLPVAVNAQTMLGILLAPTGGGGGPAITINGATTAITVSPGATMSVRATGGPGANGDQMCLGQTNTACGAVFDFADWRYLDCTQTSGSLTVTGGGPCSLTAFTAPGNYFADFVPAAGTSVYASIPFTVSGSAGSTTCTAPCVLVNGAASGASIPVGTNVTVHAGNNTAFTSVFMQQCTGTTAATCSGSNYAYMNCLQSQPGSAIAAATCTFPAPTTTGTWYYGFINNAGVVTASASFTVH